MLIGYENDTQKNWQKVDKDGKDDRFRIDLLSLNDSYVLKPPFRAAKIYLTYSAFIISFTVSSKPPIPGYNNRCQQRKVADTYTTTIKV